MRFVATCLAAFACVTASVTALGQEVEELSGFFTIPGAYDVTQSIDTENPTVTFDALLPFLQQPEMERELLEEKPFEGRLRLLNRRSDAVEFMQLNSSENEIVYEDLLITLHQCLPNVNGESGNDIAFVEVQKDMGGESVRLFSGWLYKKFPSVNVFEHPYLNVKLSSCEG